jgi:uncharacterized membrane protein SpoIIM required for sporulation
MMKLKSIMIRYLNYTKWLYLVVALVYIIALIIGFNLPIESGKNALHKPIKQESFLSYFLHNSNIALDTITSVITFGILPMYICALNGIILGNALRMTMEYSGSFLKTFSMLFPHSIFEIPAILTCCVLGMFLVKKLVKLIVNKNEKIIMLEDIKMFITGVIIAFVLLFLASISEYYFSPTLD